MLIVFGYNWFKRDTCEEYFIHVLAVCSILRKVAGGWDIAYVSIAVVGPASRRVVGPPIPYLSFCCLRSSLKGNVVPVHVMKAYRGSRGVAPLVLNLGII
jgi:hypothetical protein